MVLDIKSRKMKMFILSLKFYIFLIQLKITTNAVSEFNNQDQQEAGITS